MIKPALKSSLQWTRRTILRCRGVAISPPRWLARGIDCRLGVNEGATGRIEIAPAAWIERGVVLHAFGGQIRIGRDVFLGPHTVIYGHGGVEIGDACLIAMHCRIVSSNHTIPDFETDIRWQPDVCLPTKIGRGVWLGAGVTVLGGVSIGDGCIVGAGAVVTKDLPAGSIAHGTPAKIQGWREGAPRI